MAETTTKKKGGGNSKKDPLQKRLEAYGKAELHRMLRLMLLGRRFEEKSAEAYALGDVSFHAGWTFHRAGPNNTDQMRGVMTVIMMEDGIRLIEPQRQQHENDWHRWCPGAEIGEKVQSPLNPVIYSHS